MNPKTADDLALIGTAIAAAVIKHITERLNK